MRVLVTGASSPLGLAVIRELLDAPDVDQVLAVAHETVPFEHGAHAARLSFELAHLDRPREAHDLLFGPARELAIDTLIHGSSLGSNGHQDDAAVARTLVVLAARHPTIGQFVFRSAGEVYAIRPREPNLLDEDQPLELDPGAPDRVRAEVEADLAVVSHPHSTALRVAVLRCAEVFAPGVGSQLWDYLSSRVCLRPLGFDPMINVLSPEDCARALVLASAHRAEGIFNIPGADTLPLSAIIARGGRLDVPVPGPLLAPLYRLRTRVTGLEFHYDRNLRRFHFGGILDGRRARIELGYLPNHPIDWRREQLARQRHPRLARMTRDTQPEPPRGPS